MGSTFKVGTIEVEEGSFVCAEVPVTKKPDGRDLFIPLMVVHGVQKGPVMLAIGGTHADEHEGPIAIMKTARSLDPNKVTGTFVGVPYLNVQALIDRTSMKTASRRENSIDGKDISFLYPGNPEGTVSERIAHVVTSQLMENADFLLDLHSAGGMSAALKVAGYGDAPGDYGKRSLELAKLFPAEILWRIPFTETKSPLADIAYKNDILLFNSEVRGEGRCREEDVQFFCDGMRNAMVHFGMISGQVTGLPSRRMVVGPTTWLRNQEGGIFRAVKKVGERISEGEVIGTIIDVFGNEIENMTAPFDGIVFVERTNPVVWPSDHCFSVAEVLEEGV